MNSNGFMTVISNESGSKLSTGCCSPESLDNKSLENHVDEIMVMSLTHNMSHTGNSRDAAHGPVVIAKYVDKSSPLLAKALTTQDKLTCKITFYRKSVLGVREALYSIELRNSTIESITLDVPHAVLHNGMEPQEIVALRYQDIIWNHHKAQTTESATWFTD